MYLLYRAVKAKCFELCAVNFWVFPHTNIPQFIWEPVPAFDHSHIKYCSLFSWKTSQRVPFSGPVGKWLLFPQLRYVQTLKNKVTESYWFTCLSINYSVSSFHAMKIRITSGVWSTMLSWKERGSLTLQTPTN